jgi:hypothetical protein
MGQQKPERLKRISVQQLVQNLRLPRHGSRCAWIGRHLIDPETQEVVASCLLWAYGPVGAYACSEQLTDLLFLELPETVQEALAERVTSELNDLVVRLRQENIAAGGEKEPRLGGSHGGDDAGDGRQGA